MILPRILNIYLDEEGYFNYLYLPIIFYPFYYVIYDICIDFDNEQKLYLINLYIFVTCVGEPQSVVTYISELCWTFKSIKALKIIIKLFIVV